MSALVAILIVGALFVGYGLLGRRLGRRPGCGLCAGDCDACPTEAEEKER